MSTYPVEFAAVWGFVSTVEAANEDAAREKAKLISTDECINEWESDTERTIVDVRPWRQDQTDDEAIAQWLEPRQ